MLTLSDRFASELSLINSYLESLVPELEQPHPLQLMAESCRYAINSDGKRFRALLSLLTARALGHELNLVLPYAGAVELIHTYSLVHDDLPCMDDDDYRRGRPSLHKVYGEAMGVLCGDALQTLAFEVIADSYQQMPKLAIQSLKVLTLASGYQGMVGGQSIDIQMANGLEAKSETIKKLHQLKTGKLIQASTHGAAILCGAAESLVEKFEAFGGTLGLAFQVADDLLDHDPQNPEAMGFPKHIGLAETHNMLKELSDDCLERLTDLGEAAKDLEFVVEFNRQRVSPN